MCTGSYYVDSREGNLSLGSFQVYQSGFPWQPVFHFGISIQRVQIFIELLAREAGKVIQVIGVHKQRKKSRLDYQVNDPEQNFTPFVQPLQPSLAQHTIATAIHAVLVYLNPYYQPIAIHALLFSLIFTWLPLHAQQRCLQARYAPCVITSRSKQHSPPSHSPSPSHSTNLKGWIYLVACNVRIFSNHKKSA